ncbi:MAG: GntR family transcriptional regulator, partial [Gammaproteobacteria bacterium]|nr:GntR family transcriptional regulator [Gammaproteobacteria bacterium]NIR85078.1 GntR family transcriptional regulator [Gammaproteobacteria bacterium]NIU06128.1 GntR family transcriptional regulator [Gammaproteobacteria bacterium]NIV50580.1 GntR family transcriptional regulator [Gammaproteobacteria bacterium]NIX87401.1 GntR family transcriptional regulator [Gammaproteobacteria bacterium]
LDRRSQMPLHRQLRRRLALAIETGELAPGELLPSVRQLAARVGVNRLTALKALQALRRAGLVHNRRGRGYYVADRSARDDVGEEDR